MALPIYKIFCVQFIHFNDSTIFYEKFNSVGTSTRIFSQCISMRMVERSPSEFPLEAMKEINTMIIQNEYTLEIMISSVIFLAVSRVNFLYFSKVHNIFAIIE